MAAACPDWTEALLARDGLDRRGSPIVASLSWFSSWRCCWGAGNGDGLTALALDAVDTGRGGRSAGLSACLSLDRSDSPIADSNPSWLELLSVTAPMRMPNGKATSRPRLRVRRLIALSEIGT